MVDCIHRFHIMFPLCYLLLKTTLLPAENRNTVRTLHLCLLYGKAIEFQLMTHLLSNLKQPIKRASITMPIRPSSYYFSSNVNPSSISISISSSTHVTSIFLSMTFVLNLLDQSSYVTTKLTIGYSYVYEPVALPNTVPS